MWGHLIRSTLKAASVMEMVFKTSCTSTIGIRSQLGQVAQNRLLLFPEGIFICRNH